MNQHGDDLTENEIKDIVLGNNNNEIEIVIADEKVAEITCNYSNSLNSFNYLFKYFEKSNLNLFRLRLFKLNFNLFKLHITFNL